MELIAPPDATNHTDDAPDTSCNPRAELEALERAHLLIANGAAQQILEHGYAIEELRPVVFEHRAKAAVIRRLAEMLLRGGESAPQGFPDSTTDMQTTSAQTLGSIYIVPSDDLLI